MHTDSDTSRKLFSEGKTQFYVPTNSLEQSPPPRTPAFFNTMAKLKRDLLITIFDSYASQCDDKITFSDTYNKSINNNKKRIFLLIII